MRGSGGAAPVGAVNGYRVLETVAALPVSTWRYVWEPADVRHLGPMAQDWHAAFGFDHDDTRIPVVDGLGVALVCIQALNRRVDELTVELGRLREAAGEPAPGSTTTPDAWSVTAPAAPPTAPAAIRRTGAP
ncbi:tail fiber domain-containing protein [Kitasatospora sp. NBC_00458]|uniref:tail fiber domain-containing protein n=1 Tax=Kitasatospora sp. NBC_00458 TaxID=2903568 RepID=UPI002E17D618